MNEAMGMGEVVTKEIGRSVHETLGMGSSCLKHNIEFLHIRDGKVIDKREIHNAIVNAGFAAAAGRICNIGSVNPFEYLAIGIGNTGVLVTDTDLDSEITTGGGARAGSTNSRVTTNVTSDTAQFTHTWTFTSTFAIVESGIFNAASTGDMLARQVFSAINVNNGDSLAITWKVVCQ